MRNYGSYSGYQKIPFSVALASGVEWIFVILFRGYDLVKRIRDYILGKIDDPYPEKIIKKLSLAEECAL